MTQARVSDAELAALIAGLTATTPEEPARQQSVELLVSQPQQTEQGTDLVQALAAATCRGGCGTTLTGRDAAYGICPRCALKGSGDDLFTPAAPPAATMGATITLLPGAPPRTAPVPAPSNPPTTVTHQPVPGPTTCCGGWVGPAGDRVRCEPCPDAALTAYRVLVTGSRTWTDTAMIYGALNDLHRAHRDRLVIVHGACPKGADAIADAWCQQFGVPVERHPADWDGPLDKQAGFARNQAMVDTRPDYCLAFIYDNSKGAQHTANAADAAGIELMVYRDGGQFAAPQPTPTGATTPLGLPIGGRSDLCPGCGTDHPTGACRMRPPSDWDTETPTGNQVTWDPPPSTVAELRPVLTAFDAARPRSMQVRLGPSELGTPCQQQMARKLAGAPTQPITAPPWAAMQGTAMHALMEEALGFWNARLDRANPRWLAEDDLAVDQEIRGHGDAFDQDYGMVVDWKYVGTTALKKLRTARRAGKPPAEQVSPEYRVQAHLYGVGHERKGRDVRHVRLVLLARSWQYDDSDEWTERYQPDIAFAALDRYYATQDLLTVLDVARQPDMIAAVPTSPGPDVCRWCPFSRPGQPNNWGGCPGDVATAQAKSARFADGLIAP